MLSSFDSAPDTNHVGGHPPDLPHLVDAFPVLEGEEQNFMQYSKCGLASIVLGG